MQWALAVAVAAAACACSAAGFRVDQSSRDYLTLYEDDVPVLRYVRGEILPEGVPEDRRRSTYIHPIYSLDGTPLTDDFPKDHHHHRGLSWMWLRVSYGGKTSDLWTLKGLRQKYISSETDADAASATLVIRNGWFEDDSGRKLIDEKVTLLVMPADEHGRDLALTLELSAVDEPVSLGVSNTGYSGLNLRFAPRQDTVILSSRGQVPKDGDRIRCAWADLSARFAGSERHDGIAILDMPSNPHFPAGWTLRHYGVLNPAFTSTSIDYTIQPGHPLRLDYVISVHRGKGDADRLWTKFRDYAGRIAQLFGRVEEDRD